MIENLTIGGVARRTGMNIETIRFYEKKRLLSPPPRSAGGHRLYSPQAVRRLGFIKRSRELGFTLAEVTELLAIVDREQVSCEQAKQIADRHVAAVRGKIADLEQIEMTLNELIEQCSSKNVPECPIIDALVGGQTSC